MFTQKAYVANLGWNVKYQMEKKNRRLLEMYENVKKCMLFAIRKISG